MSQSQSTFTSSSFSYSSNINGEERSTGHRAVQQTYTDPSGTTVRQATQALGEPAVQEERHYDPQGREMIQSNGNDTSQRRMDDVTDDQQAENDRLYEERMADEYAKREGGA
jgi:hypothetical protein